MGFVVQLTIVFIIYMFGHLLAQSSDNNCTTVDADLQTCYSIYSPVTYSEVNNTWQQNCENVECLLQCMSDAIGDCYLMDKYFTYEMAVQTVYYRASCANLEINVASIIACQVYNVTCLEETNSVNVFLAAISHLNNSEYAEYKDAVCNYTYLQNGCINPVITENCTAAVASFYESVLIVSTSYSQCGNEQTHEYFTTYNGPINCVNTYTLGTTTEPTSTSQTLSYISTSSSASASTSPATSEASTMSSSITTFSTAISETSTSSSSSSSISTTMSITSFSTSPTFFFSSTQLSSVSSPSSDETTTTTTSSSSYSLSFSPSIPSSLSSSAPTSASTTTLSLSSSSYSSSIISSLSSSASPPSISSSSSQSETEISTSSSTTSTNTMTLRKCLCFKKKLFTLSRKEMLIKPLKIREDIKLFELFCGFEQVEEDYAKLSLLTAGLLDKLSSQIIAMTTYHEVIITAMTTYHEGCSYSAIISSLGECSTISIDSFNTSTADEFLKDYCDNIECNILCYINAIGECYKDDQFFTYDIEMVKVSNRAFCNNYAETWSAFATCQFDDFICLSTFASALTTDTLPLYNDGNYMAYRKEYCSLLATLRSCLTVSTVKGCNPDLASLFQDIFLTSLSYSKCEEQTHSYFTTYGHDVMCGSTVMFSSNLLIIITVLVALAEITT